MVRFQTQQAIFLFSKTSTLVLRPTGMGDSLPGVKAIGALSSPHLYLAPRLGVSTAIIPLAHMTSCCAQGQFYCHSHTDRRNSGFEQWNSLQFMKTAWYVVGFCPVLLCWLSVVCYLLWRSTTQWPASNIFTGNQTCYCCRNKGNSWWWRYSSSQSVVHNAEQVVRITLR